MSAEIDATPAQAAHAWLLTRGSDFAPAAAASPGVTLPRRRPHRRV